MEVSDNVIMAENNHQTLQVEYEEESSEKEEVVLESLAHDDLPPSSENEEFVEEEQFIPDPMDVHIFAIDNITASNTDFQEQFPFLLMRMKNFMSIFSSFILIKNLHWKMKGVLVFLLTFKTW